MRAARGGSASALEARRRDRSLARPGPRAPGGDPLRSRGRRSRAAPYVMSIDDAAGPARGGRGAAGRCSRGWSESTAVRSPACSSTPSGAGRGSTSSKVPRSRSRARSSSLPRRARSWTSSPVSSATADAGRRQSSPERSVRGLAELAMPDASFEVQISGGPRVVGRGEPSQVELMIAPNAGVPAAPLQRDRLRAASSLA